MAVGGENNDANDGTQVVMTHRSLRGSGIAGILGPNPHRNILEISNLNLPSLECNQANSVWWGKGGGSSMTRVKTPQVACKARQPRRRDLH